MTRLLTGEAAHALACDVLVAHRTSPANAAVVAHALVAADLDGIGSHGLSRLPVYAGQALCGKVDGFATPRVVATTAAAVQVDACCGFAFPALSLALEQAHALATAAGIGAVAVANSHHCGVAGHHVEWLAERGMVALMFANTPAAMAPWGGDRASFGTNPIAFAAPRAAAQPPLVIDLSLSKVARGRIMLARQRGEAIEPGWALDADGQPTTDATAALAGSMVPLGDAKGAALALMVEILAATLTGSLPAFEASSFLDAAGGPPRVGQLIIALSPQAFAAGDFTARIDHLIGHILGQAGTRLPGARRITVRAQRGRDGIPVEDGLIAELERLRAGPV